MTMRQLRQASLQGYNVLGRSHENLQGAMTSPYLGSRYQHHHHGPPRREPLRRYASAQNLPFSNASNVGVQYRGSAANVSSTAPVLRISGDFEDMWNRHRATAGAGASAQHTPVFGRGIGCILHVISTATACTSSSLKPLTAGKAIALLSFTHQSVIVLIKRPDFLSSIYRQPFHHFVLPFERVSFVAYGDVMDVNLLFA